MKSNKKIEDRAKKYASQYAHKVVQDIAEEAFIEGAISDIAEEYYDEQRKPNIMLVKQS